MSARSAHGIAVLVLASVPAAQTVSGSGVDHALHAPRLARRAQLAGESVAAFPHFVPRRTFQETEPIEVAVDPLAFPDVVGRTARVHVVATRTPAEWAANPALADLTGAVETLVLGPTLAGNVVVADAGTLDAGSGVALALGYDVVVDLDGNGLLSTPDLIDGLGPEPGLFVARDPSAPGPFGVVEVAYALPGPLHAQNLYYPAEIASLGLLPVVLLAHGSGQSYFGFDHVGQHLASHGFVVVSHQVNVTPGPAAAAVSVLENTELFLLHHATVAGGALVGHVDPSRLAWIGVRRGGEAVVAAHSDVARGSFPVTTYDVADVRAIVALQPSDFLGTSDPGAAAFALIAGAATPGECPLEEPFRILDRGVGPRRSLYVQGASASDHYPSGATGPGDGVGPCPTGPADVQALVRGYLVPLLAHDLRGEPAGRDFLTRPWEAFHPLSAPAGPCVEVELSYRAGAGAQRLVVDDFQSQPSTGVSSSGAPVTSDLPELVEGLLDDPDPDLTHLPGQPMNAMTYAGPGDDSRGAVLGFDGDRFLAFELPGAPLDVRGYSVLSLRACQRARHPFTAALLAPLDFTIELEDAGGATSAVRVSALGSELVEPYQRVGCGLGAGWVNELETIRVPLASFQRVDRSRLARVVLRFGPSHGSAIGAMGLDDLELVADGG